MASILLSESDPDVRRLLVVLLERLGHEAIVLEDGVATPPSRPASSVRNGRRFPSSA